jgi:hypothetical protein
MALYFGVSVYVWRKSKFGKCLLFVFVGKMEMIAVPGSSLQLPGVGRERLAIYHERHY